MDYGKYGMSSFPHKNTLATQLLTSTEKNAHLVTSRQSAKRNTRVCPEIYKTFVDDTLIYTAVWYIRCQYKFLA